MALNTTKKQLKPYRADLDFPELDDDSEIKDIIRQHNELVKGINFLNKFISFQSNFEGYIATVSIPAGQSLKIQHFLGVTPKWRVLLRQEGNGVISDIPSDWNETFIALKNNGSEEVKISVLIARE